MSRLFDDVQSEYLKIDQAVLSGIQIAMACWFNTNDLTVSQYLMTIADKDSLVDWYALFYSSEKNIKAHAKSGAASGTAATPVGGVEANTWHHVVAIFTNTTNRRVRLNGGATHISEIEVIPANLDATNIGVLRRSSLLGPMSGHIAEAAMWDLTQWPGADDNNRANNFERIVPSLAKGFSPLCFPLGLKAYWPLVRGINDRVGGYDLTAVGSIVSPHTRIISPMTPLQITEAIVGQDYFRTIDDSLGITDVDSKISNSVRTLTDTLGITDDVSRIVSYLRTQDDDIGLIDAIVRTVAILRTIDDDIGITDVKYIEELVKAAIAFMITRQTHV